MKRLLIATASVAFAACGPNNVGSTGGTTGGTATTDAGDGTNSCTPATFTCAGTGGLLYPGCPYGTSRGGVFPDFDLGGGYWNPSTTPVNDLTLPIPGGQSLPDLSMAFHQLYCSGFKYAFIDISAVWCPHCNDEAAAFPGWNATTKTYEWNAATQTGWAVKWLPLGGVIFSLLEQGENPANAATPADLTTWVNKYNINYPMAIDPQENVVVGVGLEAWPANIIIDLSTMKVVDAVFGNVPQFLTEFDSLLTSGQ
jgi:hypothetical protein